MTFLDLVLFGDPVGHSLSPVIQQAALDATRLEGTYRAIRVDADGFRRGCADLRTGHLHGANVTMPHKRLAAAETDERSPGAERSKSVNTIVVEGSRLIGHNTDINGVQQVWQESGWSEEAPVLVLGAGAACIPRKPGRPPSRHARPARGTRAGTPRRASRHRERDGRHRRTRGRSSGCAAAVRGLE